MTDTDTYTTAHGNTVKLGDRVVLTQGFARADTDKRMGTVGVLVRVRNANALDMRDQDIKVFAVRDDSGFTYSGYMVEPADFTGHPVDASTLQLSTDQVVRLQVLAMTREAFGPNLLAEDYVELAQFVTDGTKALGDALLGTAVHQATEDPLAEWERELMATATTLAPVKPKRPRIAQEQFTAPDGDDDQLAYWALTPRDGAERMIFRTQNGDRGRSAIVKGTDLVRLRDFLTALLEGE